MLMDKVGDDRRDSYIDTPEPGRRFTRRIALDFPAKASLSEEKSRIGATSSAILPV
jgi:hypothetical protein